MILTSQNTSEFHNHLWDIRIKIVTLFLLVLGIISLNTPIMLLLSLVFLLLLALYSGLTIKFMLTRVTVLLPFLILMSIPLLLGGGISEIHYRYEFVLLLVLKALSSFIAMLIMVATQPLEEFLHALGQLKVPAPLISIIFLTYRYTLLFISEIKSTKNALQARLFKPSLQNNALQVYGEISGGMIIKAIDRSDLLYRAMSTRCFNGTMPLDNPKKICKKDILTSSIIGVLLIIMFSAERWWIM
ncbi:hypothetical protein SYNTR_1670 [Candidatus Syntrophocurvum alkaliphilum]|uniref:Transmembrane component NikQ of energizing module of nickel ECF transporter n=1 Tax=Candidatus Syntrophocurvum alkaliphilum TaxID=2293317 RepID=A0A6I6DJQ5_9FIRM|nr:energy-coupling factor transporter transmembrane component T [Candidatus Syntrophocurvum alkaliphilum]QGU00264.1 hypothetical protein SYNTR_1670 [Candidatus Syntrophocurvum alkaliphilum]